MTEGTEVRCTLCGKVMVYGDAAVSISTGKFSNSELASKNLWGIAHRSCFNKKFPAPKAALDEIRRLVQVNDG